jgi:hypothetical protein
MRIPKSAYVVGVCFALLLACSDGSVHDHDDFREDVIDCEDAVAYLAKCCPDFKASAIACQYSYDYTPGGCDSAPTTSSVSPALGVDESRCILTRSCDAIVRDGVCERALAAMPYASGSAPDRASPYESGSTVSTTHAPVCP